MKKSVVKIHTQLDLKGNIPSFFLITKAKTHDVNFLDNLEFEKDAIYIMDRGYFDFKRLWNINKQKAYFVIRAKKVFPGIEHIPTKWIRQVDCVVTK